MRLKDIAAIVAATQGHDLDQIHTRIRNPAFKSLLTPKPTTAENAHPSYSRKELCRAMLLVALSRARLTVDDLSEVNRTLNQPPQNPRNYPDWAKGEDGTITSPDVLGCIIEGSRRNAGWTLEVTVIADPTSDHALKTSLRVHAYQTDEARNGDIRGQKAVALQRKAKRQVELARITMDASSLVKPLLDDEV